MKKVLTVTMDGIRYPDYRKARNEMQELVRAQKNVERFFAEEKENTEKTQTRETNTAEESSHLGGFLDGVF